jgi:hypothetical protein
MKYLAFIWCSICCVPILIAHSHTHYIPNDHFVLFYLSCLYLQHLKFVILSKINACGCLQLPALCGFSASFIHRAFVSSVEDTKPKSPWSPKSVQVGCHLRLQASHLQLVEIGMMPYCYLVDLSGHICGSYSTERYLLLATNPIDF